MTKHQTTSKHQLPNDQTLDITTFSHCLVSGTCDLVIATGGSF